MRRRDFIAFVGSASAWPLAASAQQPALPVVGFLDSGSPDGMSANLAAFQRGLGETGYREGTNVTVEYRWARGQYDQLPVLATELVRRQVAVIAATRNPAPGLAAKAATSTIPIVFQTGTDPVQDGLVASLNRPGGNVTGVSRLSNETIPKQLGLISEIVPNATVIAVLANPTNVGQVAGVAEVQESARVLGLQPHIVNASTERELDAAFAVVSQTGASALFVFTDQLFIARREQIVALALRHAIPTIFSVRESVVAGGLMSYAASFTDSFRQVGVYVGRILKGAKPADLPVQQPTKFELVINLITAKALGLTIPHNLLVLADEVIE
jgi:putative tryptophan/tyrosine transport system substrate-binding protein